MVGVGKVEFNDGAKEMMGFSHAKVVNDGGTADEKDTLKMDIERHMVRSSVAEAEGNRKLLSNPIGVCF